MTHTFPPTRGFRRSTDIQNSTDEVLFGLLGLSRCPRMQTVSRRPLLWTCVVTLLGNSLALCWLATILFHTFPHFSTPRARVLLPQQPVLPGHVCLHVQSAPGLARRWVAIPITSPGQRLARWLRGCAWGLWRVSHWPPWSVTVLWPWVSPCWPGPCGLQPSCGPWSP